MEREASRKKLMPFPRRFPRTVYEANTGNPGDLLLLTSLKKLSAGASIDRAADKLLDADTWPINRA